MRTTARHREEKRQIGEMRSDGEAMTAEARVFVVDDDQGYRDSVLTLLMSAGFTASGFASGRDFLAWCTRETRGCVLCDVRMPDMDGLRLQSELRRRDMDLPLIFASGHADVPMAVRALKTGAVDFLEKPYAEDRLLESVRRALAMAAETARSRESSELARRKIACLTAREHEVLNLVAAGMTSRQIARWLAISPRTVELHRVSIMEKSDTDNLAVLVRMVVDAKGNH